MTDDQEFFLPGVVYTERKPEWGTRGHAREFEAVLVTETPGSGERVAFGFFRWENTSDWHPFIRIEAEYERYIIKTETVTET